MIRVNLIATAREHATTRAPLAIAHKLTMACSLILVLAGAFIGWRYWSLSRTSNRLDIEITEAQQETTRLHSIILQVQQYELRKTQLQQRVTLIEQLRKGQKGPVHILDQVSRSLPPSVWLTGMKQSPADIVIDGSGTGLTGLSDFVKNLESSGYFAHPVEIISTTSEALPLTGGELIKFSIKAHYESPTDPTPPAAGTRVGG